MSNTAMMTNIGEADVLRSLPNIGLAREGTLTGARHLGRLGIAFQAGNFNSALLVGAEQRTREVMRDEGA